jgi:four helix bundle protein
LTDLRIYGFTDLRICGFADLRIHESRFAACTVHSPAGVNPRAEALKRRTFAFALLVIRFSRALRQTWEGRELADQLIRSGTRVGANYRSACRARSFADFVNKIGVVVEEADECVYWLELIEASGTYASADLDTLIAEARELSAIFNQSQLTARSNARAGRNK